MKTVTVYSPAELKDKFPDAFDYAFEHWKSDQNEIPWSDEIMNSLKAIFKASGIHLYDWSMGTESYCSYVKFYMDHNVRDISGNRALAWLENNLFAPLRIKANKKEYYQYHESYRPCGDCRPYQIGKVPPCPFTGYCADEDFIDSLMNDIKSGSNLYDAFNNLADVASHLFEQEYEQATSEERFLDQTDLQYTKEGRPV